MSMALTIVGLTVVGTLVVYAAYFDYKRRSDPSLRKKLRKPCLALRFDF